MNRSFYNFCRSEFEDEHVQLPPLTPAPNKDGKKTDAKTYQHKNLPKILPNLTMPSQGQPNGGQNKQGPIPSLPFPLLILNGVQAPNNASVDKKDLMKNTDGPKVDAGKKIRTNKHVLFIFFLPDMTHILKEILEVQKENLDIERQRLELEKQRLEFERFVGSQLLAMGPVIGSLFQRFAFAAEENPECNDKSRMKRRNSCDIDMLKESKILKTLLSEGIKKCMMGDEDSENEDSSTHNDDSNASRK
jgi:hypothetical protein